MNEYKRLTARKEDRYWEQEEFWQSAEEPSYEKIEEIYTRLAELEDKIESGKLVDTSEPFLIDRHISVWVIDPKYNVGEVATYRYSTKEAAKLKLKELQERKNDKERVY